MSVLDLDPRLGRSGVDRRTASSGRRLSDRLTPSRNGLARLLVLAVPVAFYVTTFGNSPVASPIPETNIGSALVTASGAALGSEEPAYVHTVELIASYRIDGDLQDISMPPAHAHVLEVVRNVFPPEQMRRISQLVLVEEQPAELIAVVHRSRVDDDKWILTLDLLDSDSPGLLIETLIHELAHIETLGADDFDFTPTQGCDGRSLELGCARSGSIIDQFASAFWAEGNVATEPTRMSFVSHYATTAAQEDLAESFLSYVLGPTPEPGSIAAQKVSFFDDHPRMRELGEAISARIGG